MLNKFEFFTYDCKIRQIPKHVKRMLNSIKSIDFLYVLQKQWNIQLTWL